MAFESTLINITKLSDCTEFTVTDDSDYSGHTITNVAFDIILANGQTITLTPVLATTYFFNAVNLFLGTAGERLPDGAYEIVYRLKQDSIDKSKTMRIILTCEIDCCLMNNITKLAVNDCDCKGKEITKYSNMLAGLIGAGYETECGNIVQANKIITNLLTECNSKDCGCS